MGVQLFTNNSSTTLASGILAGTTSIALAPGTGALFPAITGTDYFYVTFDDGAGTREIVKVTARSTDTLTVTRAQEGTSAAAFDAGDIVELRPTAAGLTNFVQKTDSTLTIDDANFTIQDNSDQTKQVKFQASGVTTGTTRTITVPDANITLASINVAQTLTAQQTFTEVKDTVYTITDGAAFEIDPANGSVQVVTLGASRTPAATNFEAGQTVLLGIDDGTAYAVTWTTVNPTWVTPGGGGAAPTLATSGYTWILFTKVGSTIYGSEWGQA